LQTLLVLRNLQEPSRGELRLYRNDAEPLVLPERRMP
jgi:hypothetical protein